MTETPSTHDEFDEFTESLGLGTEAVQKLRAIPAGHFSQGLEQLVSDTVECRSSRFADELDVMDTSSASSDH